jgi:hypothetical protein
MDSGMVLFQPSGHSEDGSLELRLFGNLRIVDL